MFYQMIAVLTFCAVCLAQVPHFGKCPDIPVQKDFNISKYVGDWYEIQKFFFFALEGETCLRANYSLKVDGHVKVLNIGKKADGSRDERIGDAYSPDPNNKAKIAVQFDGAPRVQYWILDTNYTDYALVWSCSEYGGGLLQADLAWVLSRKPTLETATVTMLVNKLASYDIDTSSFTDTVQTDCGY